MKLDVLFWRKQKQSFVEKHTKNKWEKDAKEFVYDRYFVPSKKFLQSKWNSYPKEAIYSCYAWPQWFDWEDTAEVIYVRKSHYGSVFTTPMKNRMDFPFIVLQPSGGCSKSLSIPALSSSYQWTAGTVAGKNSKMPIYILAQDSLDVSECM